MAQPVSVGRNLSRGAVQMVAMVGMVAAFLPLPTAISIPWWITGLHGCIAPKKVRTVTVQIDMARVLMTFFCACLSVLSSPILLPARSSPISITINRKPCLPRAVLVESVIYTLNPVPTAHHVSSPLVNLDRSSTLNLSSRCSRMWGS